MRINGSVDVYSSYAEEPRSTGRTELQPYVMVSSKKTTTRQVSLKTSFSNEWRQSLVWENLEKSEQEKILSNIGVSHF